MKKVRSMPPRIKRYVVGILVISLIISIGLNLYDRFVTFPQMQANINNLRAKALQEWRGEMISAYHDLRNAQTNFDVVKAQGNIWKAKKYVFIYGTGIDYDPENLYYWLSRSTSYLDNAMERTYLGNTTGTVTERNLDQYVLQRIGNIAQAAKNITDNMTIIVNGVDPVQQLVEQGTLNDIINYCDIIIEASTEILSYIGYPQ